MRYSQKKKAPPSTRISTAATIHLMLNLGISLLFGVWDALNWRTGGGGGGGDGAVHEACSPLPAPAVQVSSRRMLMASSPPA